MVKVLCCVKEEERKVFQVEEGNRGGCHCTCEWQQSPEMEELKGNTRAIYIPVDDCWFNLICKC